ncbi:MAG TPA: hypothetical protein VK335_11465 [Bryobacteraceae bacterium]|nr:hypothetical protein [Bryobacteraceae bacterium]
MKLKYLAGAAATVILLVLLIYVYAGSQAPQGQPPLQTLTVQNISEIRNQFNAAKDDVRVLLLLSPT